jgi:hypothetical protein
VHKITYDVFLSLISTLLLLRLSRRIKFFGLLQFIIKSEIMSLTDNSYDSLDRGSAHRKAAIDRGQHIHRRNADGQTSIP